LLEASLEALSLDFGRSGEGGWKGEVSGEPQSQGLTLALSAAVITSKEGRKGGREVGRKGGREEGRMGGREEGRKGGRE